MGVTVSWLVGCTSSITAPGDPVDPVQVLLLDYGRHSSLALPAGGELTHVEYAYGDWSWFALDRSGFLDLFPTLFWPTRGALGRRSLIVETTPAGRPSVAGCEEVLEITVSGPRAAELVADLDRQFARRIDTLHEQPLYDLAFVHSDRPFHLLHNCNHAVAGWLRTLGCRVDGPALLADFEVLAATGNAPPRQVALATGRAPGRRAP